MKHTINSDYRTTLRVKLSHAQEGEIGEGMLKFGYGCLANVVLDGLGLRAQLNDNQLGGGLLAISEDGRRLSLLNCTLRGHTIYADFVVEGDVRGLPFDSFEVRYSEVSEWFLQQMHIDGKLGEEIKWHEVPAPLVANVDTSSYSFRVESFYVAHINGSGEDQTLHQHFAFRFIATKKSFLLAEIKDLVLRFSNLLSILLAKHCPIVSIDVCSERKKYGRMYYGISKSLPNNSREDENDQRRWGKFFALKSDIDGCWGEVVNAFFCSEYREVIWSRLAGMQNYEGFWEYRILGYVTLLDSYVSQRFGKSATPEIPQERRLKQLEVAIASVQPSLDSAQRVAVMNAASQIFLMPADTPFASKVQKLLGSLDPDVVKIINLTPENFVLVKQLRDDVAHGRALRFAGPDLTPVFEITNRIVVLMAHLFFLDVNLNREVFLRCLDRPHTELRMISKLDEIHLDRTLRPEKFIQVSSQELLAIQRRPRRLPFNFFERDAAGVITYSEQRSSELFDAIRSGSGGQLHEFLGLPKDAISDLGHVYFEDGTQTESIHSAIIVDMARVPTKAAR